MSWCIYMLIWYISHSKSYYYCHMCVLLVYSISVLCLSNTFVILTSNKCQIRVQQLAECPSIEHVSVKDMVAYCKTDL